MNTFHIFEALYKAEQLSSGLSSEILAVEGFATPKIRHFLNNLCNFEECNYLEVGSYMGASLLSAAYGNTGFFTGVDNFSRRRGIREICYRNLSLHAASNVKMVESDCWEFDKTSIEKVNVYFYDGDHSYDSQKRGIVEFDSVLADKFVLLVDDYTWDEPFNGTKDALAELNYKIHLKIDLNDWKNTNGWWNGYCIILAEKEINEEVCVVSSDAVQ